MPRAAWLAGGEPQLAGRGAVHDPGGQHAVVGERPPGAGDALAVEGFDRRPRTRMGIVDDPMPRAKTCLPMASFRKRDAAGDRGAVDRPGEMADEAHRDARVMTMGTAQVSALRGFSCFSVRARCPRPAEAGSPRSPPWREDKIVVAFHAGAFARQHADRNAVAGAAIAPREAPEVASATAERPSSRRAFRIGDAGTASAAPFGGGGARLQHLGPGSTGLPGRAPESCGSTRRIGEAAIGSSGAVRAMPTTRSASA